MSVVDRGSLQQELPADISSSAGGWQVCRISHARSWFLVQVRGREIHHATGTYLCITELLVDIQPCRDKLVDYKVEESTVKPLMAR